MAHWQTICNGRFDAHMQNAADTVKEFLSAPPKLSADFAGRASLAQDTSPELAKPAVREPP
jgi:hypothetical protein